MSWQDDLIRECGPWFQERQKLLFDASILDQGNRVLSTGQAILEADALVGVFWPSSAWLQGTTPESATILQKSSAADVRIAGFHKCQCGIGLGSHYHFRVESPV